MALKFNLDLAGAVFKDRAFPTFEIHFKRIGQKQYADWLLAKSPFKKNEVDPITGEIRAEAMTGEKALWLSKNDMLFGLDHIIKVEGVDFDFGELTQEQKELFWEQTIEQIPSFLEWFDLARQGAEKKSTKPTKSNKSQVESA